MKKNILVVISILVLTACSGEIDLDKEEKKELTFNQLSSELKETYRTQFSTKSDSINYYVYSLDKNFELTHYWTGINKQFLTKGFNHHFVINKKEFKLGANQGDPFILSIKKLYYTTELNLSEFNYEKAKFIEIDLTAYINELKKHQL